MVVPTKLLPSFRTYEEVCAHVQQMYMYKNDYGNLFEIASNWKLPEISMNSEMDELRCILTMEHYTAVKMNKLLLHTMTVNSHKHNVEQKSQTQKST